MSNADAARDIVSLDDYRRSRGDRRQASPRGHVVPVIPSPPAVWVYWVPVWVW